MKKTLTLLAASTALTAVIAMPAWSAMQASDGDALLRPVPALFDDARQSVPLFLASDDDDDHRRRSRHGHDDDDDNNGDDDDDDDDNRRRRVRNPAPAGTVAPPQNGLFGSGTPPRVQVN